jgi:hypothetical protein
MNRNTLLGHLCNLSFLRYVAFYVTLGRVWKQHSYQYPLFYENVAMVTLTVSQMGSAGIVIGMQFNQNSKAGCS